MNNFISVFDELSQLYEAADSKVVSKTTDLNESTGEGAFRLSPIGGFYHVEFRDRALYQLVWRKQLVIAELDHGVLRVGSMWDQHILEGHGADCLAAIRDFLFAYGEVLQKHIWSSYGAFGTEEIRAYINEGLKSGAVEYVTSEEVFVENLQEAAEEAEVEEVEVEETSDEVEEAEEETEVKTLILECAECGCLVRKEETEVNIDEETDLANVDEACAQCEKTAGYKVVGELVPYDAAESVEESVDTDEDDELSDPAFSNALMESTLTEGKIIDAVKKVATRVGADAATIVRCFAELGDIITKRDTKFYEFAEYIENKAVLKALMNGNESVLNSCTKEDIEDLAADIEEYEQDKKDGKLASADDIEEGLFDFGKKKREAERKRQEEEEAARKAELEKSKKSKWPTAADYEKYEQEQREQRRIDAKMAQYRAMGQDWNKRADSSSPSNTPYAGVNYSGGDYF